MRVAMVSIMAVLLFIVITIVIRGVSSLSLDMITQTPKGGYYFGREGGILNAIAGSFYLAAGASLLAFVLSLPVAFYLNVYSRSKRNVRSVRSALDVMWGVPSIIFGAFGFLVMMALGMKVSLLAGIITVTLLITPIMVRAMDEVMRTVPRDLYEAGFSLGATRWEFSVRVLLRKVYPGIITAFLLGFGRAIGDAASVMFTAGFTDHIPNSLLEPAATLPLAIFYQLSSPIPEVRERAYAAAIVLTVIILIISLASRLLGGRLSKHSTTD